MKHIVLLLTALLLGACGSKPKVIEAESGSDQNQAPIFSDGSAAAPANSNAPVQDMSAAEHKVTVAEVLHAEKYTYLRVQEGGADTWLAITKRDVKVGSTAYYRGGLMKKDFQSKEFNRVFETVYLVGDFRLEGEDAAAAPSGHNHAGIPAETEPLEAPKNLKPAPGAIRISELVGHLAKYEGKTVKVTGKCVKANYMIMGRNWLHLQDGSGDKLDLTVTTTDMVQPGNIVTMEGKIALNKDFGAGYRYDYIMEEAVAVK